MKDVFDLLKDTRKQIILKAVVTDYVRTAEPVGSHTLAAQHEFGVKSATIRNELAELADLGYLQQPHTSAGRVPSDRGYRFYVDRLMDPPSLDTTTARKKLTPHRREVDVIVEHTCRILSDLARYTSVATSPAVKDTNISYVSVANVGKNRLLAVVALSDGQVIHELLDLKPKSAAINPLKATNFLMERLSGKELERVGSAPITPVDDEPAEMKDLLEKVLLFLKREVESDQETEVHLEGASYIMQQPEFKDVDRLEAILSVLDQRKALYKLFSTVYLAQDVTVLIGSENPVGEMRDCSFVASTYCVNGRVAGSIGVLGPTRMDYPRAVSAVRFMANNLTEMLTTLSLA